VDGTLRTGPVGGFRVDYDNTRYVTREVFAQPVQRGLVGTGCSPVAAPTPGSRRPQQRRPVGRRSREGRLHYVPDHGCCLGGGRTQSWRGASPIPRLASWRAAYLRAGTSV